MFTSRIDVYRFSYILSPPDSRLQCTFRLWCVSYHSKQLANLNKQYYKLHVQKVTSVNIADFCLVNNFTLVFFSWVCLFIFLPHHVCMNLFCFLYMQWCLFSCQIWVKNSIVICLHLVKVRIWTVVHLYVCGERIY